MTKEQIIEQINIAFYTMADIALQIMPTPTDDPETDDYIAELEDNYKWSEKKFKKAIEALKRQISDMIDREETLDVRPVVHAHWDVIDQGSEGDECFVHVWGTLRCSNCGMERETEDGYMPEYCEGCGAKMEECDNDKCGIYGQPAK